MAVPGSLVRVLAVSAVAAAMTVLPLSYQRFIVTFSTQEIATATLASGWLPRFGGESGSDNGRQVG